MKQLGYGKDYSYNPGFAHPVHNVGLDSSLATINQGGTEALVTQEYIPASLAEHSTFGSASLLQTEEEYAALQGKEWDEGKLREWELLRNAGKDWAGRDARATHGPSDHTFRGCNKG